MVLFVEIWEIRLAFRIGEDGFRVAATIADVAELERRARRALLRYGLWERPPTRFDGNGASHRRIRFALLLYRAYHGAERKQKCTPCIRRSEADRGRTR